MFEELSGRLESTVKNLSGQGKIRESNISEALREVKRALLEADVHFRVVREFVAQVKEKALGEEVLSSVTPAQQFVKIVHDELVVLMGGAHRDIRFENNQQTRIVMAGLQGSGKTTQTAKLALHFRKNGGHRPLMVACDVHRPAAIDQLETLGKSLGIDVYSERGSSAEDIAEHAMEYARKKDYSLLIFDTAGRLHIDESMMQELRNVHAIANPHEVFFVADAMTGQDAVNVAQEFHEAVTCTGFILSKMDGDARGGAALSINNVTGVPLCYLGVGEKPDALEPFYPDRMASRILGMGDVVSLVEKAESVVDLEESKKLEKKLRRNQFTLQDFLDQLRKVQKMGSITDLLGMLPGVGGKLKGIDVDPKAIKHVEAIILSMTPAEREKPKILNASRRRRIARGSGRTVQEVNRLMRQFEDMKKMMKQMNRMSRKKGGVSGAMKNLMPM
ncbi:signal recognition particle protein [Chitinivibrio alkaliphilus]|uniref:Signal recognition particle protein n=1 Tax=Chitinivibrio alkaliphilus ACht1 TaxID=1313304 RepID=U7D783_9BACT|nr:signal recognition particle protein [Chitinivibrio alkaliphilus]ERP30952.1 signal recognition particle protein [Chitinivibrio alkaliphilus ACht1]